LDEASRPSRKSEEARYRTHQNSPSDSAYIAYLRRLAEPVVRHVTSGAKGLDFGCGPTRGMEKALHILGFSAESYDPIFFPQTELLNFHYDFLLCCEAAEHFFDPAKEFALFDRLLKPGGILGVSSKLAVGREEFANWTYRRDPTHVVFYQKETVEWLARKHEWKILELESPLWILKKS
jgi:hypothetical protein